MNAREWLRRGSTMRRPDLIVLGAPISKASITPSQAWATPPAVREALRRFSTWDAEHEVDIAELSVRDGGDVRSDRDDPDASAAHARIQAAVSGAAQEGSTVAVIGGDNSLTRPAMHGLVSARGDAAFGLLTLDAHHDCRPLDDGPRNGTPVRELIEAGLPGERVAQVGINPLGNERAHVEWARHHGVHVCRVDEIRSAGIDTCLAVAIAALTRAGATALYVDIDLDVADRSVAPACPASLPGGLEAWELLRAAHVLGAHSGVAGVDLTEVDATTDVGGMTVRLAAGVLLAFCSGLASRGRRSRRE